jgi:uridine kinase
MSYYHPLNCYFLSHIQYLKLSYAYIGIAGGTGSGKTTVVHQIMNELPDKEVGIISKILTIKENNNLSFDERALINFDHPRAIDFDLLHI